MFALQPLDRVLEALRNAGCQPQTNGQPGSYHARCPAHDDRQPSLSVSASHEGKVLLHCHAGCAPEAICQALGVTLRDLFPPREPSGWSQGWATLSEGAQWLQHKHGARRVTSYVYHRADHQPAGAVVRLDLPTGKTIRPLSVDATGTWRLGALPTPRPLYHLPKLLAAPTAQPVFVVEGETCAEALVSLGLLATTSAGGAQAAAKTDWSPLAGRVVVVVPDHDEPGHAYARDVLRQLASVGGTGRVLRLAEHCPALPPGGDVVDVLRDARWCGLGLGDAATPADFAHWLLHQAELLGRQPPSSAPHAAGTDAARDERPLFTVSADEHLLNDQVLGLLAHDATLFQRGGMLVTLADQRLVPLTASTLADRLSRLARFQFIKGERLLRQHPPRWCCEWLLARGHWPAVREVRAVVNWPILNTAGEIITSGYDPLSQVLVDAAPTVDLPATCTRDDAQAAVQKLLEVVADFPFVQPEDAAAWLAALLTGLVRFACEGPAPLFVVEANCQGTGKTLLADVLGTLLTGAPLPRMPWTRDSDEARKRITSVVLRGEPLMLLDNITRQIGGAEWAALLTGTRWTDRLLGSNAALACKVDTVWLATSNGAVYDADLARRVLPIRLETNLEHPEHRTGFRYPRLLEHVAQQRAELLAAALTLLQAWLQAGRPQPALATFGAFESWTEWVRAPLVWAGLHDPLATRDGLTDWALPERAAVVSLIQWIHSHHNPEQPWPTSADLVAAARLDAHSDLRLALEALAGELSTRKLGSRLKPWLRRNLGGRMLQPIRGHGGWLRYAVVDLKSYRRNTAYLTTTPAADALPTPSTTSPPTLPPAQPAASAAQDGSPLGQPAAPTAPLDTPAVEGGSPLGQPAAPSIPPAAPLMELSTATTPPAAPLVERGSSSGQSGAPPRLSLIPLPTLPTAPGCPCFHTPAG